jgi:hypothetical protein
MPDQTTQFSLDYLAQSCAECAESLGIDQSFALNRLVLVVNALGWDWIKATADHERVKKVPLVARHPFISSLSILEANDLRQMLDLSDYLVEFCADPHIDEILLHMKGAGSFKNYLFALAMAYRFSRAGVQVSLEPPSLRGRSDFLLELGNFLVFCECYRQGVARGNSSLDHLSELLARSRLKLASRPSLVTITITKIPSVGWERRLRELIERASRHYDTVGIPVIEHEDFCRLSVQQFPKDCPHPPTGQYIERRFPQAAAVLFRSEVPKREIDNHRKGQEFEWQGQKDLHAIVLYLPEEVKPRVPNLKKKLVRKLAQAKANNANNGRLLCVESWPFNSEGSPVMSAELARDLDAIMVPRPDVVGFLFARRRYFRGRGYRFDLYGYMNSRWRNLIPGAAWRSVFEYEWRGFSPPMSGGTQQSER